MKQITLTDEQVSRILEMTKVVFPQYKNITFERETTIGAYDYEVNLLILSNEDKYSDHLWKGISFHWYELLHTHVSWYIFSHNSKLYDHSHGYYNMIGDQIYHIDYHLVDFLYEYFKQINYEKRD